MLINNTSFISSNPEENKKSKKAYEDFLKKHVDLNSEVPLEDTFAFKLADALLSEQGRIKAECNRRVPMPITK